MKYVLLVALVGLAGTQKVRQPRQQYYESAPTGFDAQYPSLASQQLLNQNYQSIQPALQPQPRRLPLQQPRQQPQIYQQPFKGPEYYSQPQGQQQADREESFFSQPAQQIQSFQPQEFGPQQFQPQQLPQQSRAYYEPQPQLQPQPQQPRAYYEPQPQLQPQPQYQPQPQPQYQTQALFTPAAPQDAYTNQATSGQVENYRKALQEEENEARGLTGNRQQSLEEIPQQGGQDYSSLLSAYASRNEGRQAAKSFVNVQYGPNKGYSFDVTY